MTFLRFLEEDKDLIQLVTLSELHKTKVTATIVDAKGNIVEDEEQGGLAPASIAAAVIFPILFVAVVIGGVILWKRRAASKDNSETANAKSVEPEIGDEFAAERSGGIFDSCIPGTIGGEPSGEEPSGEQTYYGDTYGEQTFGGQTSGEEF